MDVDHPERDYRWNDGARAETETERLERNWLSLLQELRVAQTGVQLTGFLPTLPFQQPFDRLRRDAPCTGCCFSMGTGRVPDGIQAAAAD